MSFDKLDLSNLLTETVTLLEQFQKQFVSTRKISLRDIADVLFQGRMKNCIFYFRFLSIGDILITVNEQLIECYFVYFLSTISTDKKQAKSRFKNKALRLK